MTANKVISCSSVLFAKRWVFFGPSEKQTIKNKRAFCKALLLMLMQ
jgi:hypothetical protein